MLTSSGYGAISPISPAKVYHTTTEREARAQTVSTHNYDSVTFSSRPKGESRFHMDLVSRLSHEVRTATTTGDIQSLRAAVSSGTYTPNPEGIAGRILLLGEA